MKNEIDQAKLVYTSSTLLVQDLINRYQKGTLNLEPGFQRRSVWKLPDRIKLIDSIFRGYPMPAIFLYRRQDGHRTVYDVIDGKQRLESILGFVGEMRGRRFEAKLQLQNEQPEEQVSWNRLRRLNRHAAITEHKVQVIEVDGDLDQIILLFVRINSTGKALTSAEKQHAKYHQNSPFFKAAATLAEKMIPLFKENLILGETQISRMKHVQLVSELMLSVHRAEPVHKKQALDAVMSRGEMNARQIEKAVQRTRAAIKRVVAVLPNIKATRFRKASDLYSLALVMAQLEEKRLVLADRKRNRLAGDLLVLFGLSVDAVNDKRRRVEGATAEESLSQEYLRTVIEGTDSYPNRKKRHEILTSLLEPIFEPLEHKRVFTPEQRRILWNTTDIRACQSCRTKLTWADFTIDHIKPYSRGGRTDLANAAIYCKPCNSAKGSGRKRAAAKSRRKAA